MICRMWHGRTSRARADAYASFPAKRAEYLDGEFSGSGSRCYARAAPRALRVDVELDAQRYPNGRFARLHDPEGNPIELWEPDP